MYNLKPCGLSFAFLDGYKSLELETVHKQRLSIINNKVNIVFMLMTLKQIFFLSMTQKISTYGPFLITKQN